MYTLLVVFTTLFMKSNLPQHFSRRESKDLWSSRAKAKGSPPPAKGRVYTDYTPVLHTKYLLPPVNYTTLYMKYQGWSCFNSIQTAAGSGTKPLRDRHGRVVERKVQQGGLIKLVSSMSWARRAPHVRAGNSMSYSIEMSFPRQGDCALLVLVKRIHFEWKAFPNGQAASMDRWQPK
eukprot:sb/3471857/